MPLSHIFLDLLLSDVFLYKYNNNAKGLQLFKENK